ncbi:MAG: FAD-dependent oxidoreductase [Candidatus Bathyarchaeia archaeon]|nr:FAD-dependent oxidoreductase [Candidatus Bathyarchaeota archaeon]
MVEKNYYVDVLVVGGGMAGVSAAIAAARNGVETLLVEKHTSLGGIATNGLVNGIAGVIEGICREFLDRMDAHGAVFRRLRLPTFDPEKAKYVLEQWVIEEGVQILYDTYAIDAVVEDNVLKHVIFHNKSGKISVEAKVVVDATGDADIAAYAGAPCAVGGKDFAGLNMSTTLMFKVDGVNMRKYTEAEKEYAAKLAEAGKPPKRMIAALQEEAVKNGDLPYFVWPGALIYPVPGTTEENCEVTVTMAHSLYCRTLNGEDLTRQLIEQRQQIYLLEKFFRKYVPGFENCRVSGIASVLGVRDSRRIIGEYILTAEDVASARKFDDGVAREAEGSFHHPTSKTIGVRMPAHIHVKSPVEPATCKPAECTAEMHPIGWPKGKYEAIIKPGEYWEIPYRCLVPLKIDNLLAAGRCISTDFYAAWAVRVIAACMKTGQAAGTAAALCIKKNTKPRELDGKLVRKTLIEQGVRLDKDIAEVDPCWAAIKRTQSWWPRE